MSQLARHVGREAAVETIAMHAWERWTRNGFNLDSDALAQTCNRARDVADNLYCAGIDDEAWLAETIAALEGKTEA